MTPKALLIDFDDTLCDSLSALKDTYVAFLAQAGVDSDGADFHLINGPPLAEVVRDLRRRYDLKDNPEDLLHTYLELAATAQYRSPPAAGADGLLRRAAAQACACYVVTSAKRAAVETWLAENGLAPMIAGVVGGDDVARGKPDPAPYLAALAESGCSVDQAWAVEDSEQGARSALDAGLGTWMIGTAAPDGLAEAPGFLGTLPDLSALTARL